MEGPHRTAMLQARHQLQFLQDPQQQQLPQLREDQNTLAAQLQLLGQQQQARKLFQVLVSLLGLLRSHSDLQATPALPLHLHSSSSRPSPSIQRSRQPHSHQWSTSSRCQHNNLRRQCRSVLGLQAAQQKQQQHMQLRQQPHVQPRDRSSKQQQRQHLLQRTSKLPSSAASHRLYTPL
jgi:hypothetical protein